METKLLSRLVRLCALIALPLCFLCAALPSRATTAGEPEEAAVTDLVIDSNSLLGSYLAGRVARFMRDADNAATYYQRALEKDPDNEAIIDDAFQLELAAGNFDNARELAQKLIKQKTNHRIARLFLGLDAFRQKNYRRADANFAITDKSSPGEPTVTLARAWTALAQGRADRALTMLNKLNKVEWAEHFATVHRALIADLASKRSISQAAFEKLAEGKSGNARIIEAYSRHLAHWGKTGEAIKILQQKSAGETPIGKVLLEQLQKGEKPQLLAPSSKDGLAEVFLGIGQILVSNNGVDAAHIYIQLALFLNPDSAIAQLELAEVYSAIDNHEKATAALDAIPQTSPLWLGAQIRKALHLNALERTSEAVAVLTGLMAGHPSDIQIPQTIGSMESGRKNYDAAIPFYTKAIESIPAIEKRHWSLFYARGVAYERTKQWPKAEADFKQALALDPEQGVVLNYLGYSWLDQNMHIDKAMDMIRKAVSLKPNDGYIIDSLGWAYYLKKDYETALKHLERAVELRPEDPTLNDHLGDVYWKVGRRLEAQFQWSQALSLEPEPEDAETIRAKLSKGLLEDSTAQAQAKPEDVNATPQKDR